ncbi:MAG: hypothetical protein JJV89_02135, partial [Desulfosarcina sp.]|nr:hypothetical protein [Desulfobacterales bacterium]
MLIGSELLKEKIYNGINFLRTMPRTIKMGHFPRIEKEFATGRVCNKTTRFAVALIFIIFFFAASLLPALATPEPGTTHEKNKSANEIEKKIHDIRQRVKRAELSENELSAKKLNVNPADLRKRTSILRETQGIYESVLTAINKKKTLTKEQKLLEKRFHGQHIGINEKPPYALSFYDSMLAEESAVRQQSETARLEIRLSKKSRLDAESKLDSLEKRLRSLRDQMDGEESENKIKALKWALE